MKSLTKRTFALVGILALGLTAVRAQDAALIDALVKKGVLTSKDANDIRASEAKENATSGASKISLSDHITNLKLYGDARLRWEYIDETPQATNGGWTGSGSGGPSNSSKSSTYSHDNVVERSRYRIRLGADYTFTDNFKAGFELESATAGDSANQSFGNGFSKESINVGLVYLQYKPVDWLTLTGGKQRNPLYTTDLVWDPDINPEGASEVMSWTIPVDFGDSAPASGGKDMKDMKAMVAPAPSTASFTIGLTAAQFCYADNQEYNTPNSSYSSTGPVTSPGGIQPTNSSPIGANDTDVWMFVEQVPIQFNFDKTMYIKEVPGFISYMSGGTTGIPSGFVNGSGGDTGWTGGSSLNFTGPNVADHLQIFTAPGEFDWKAWDIPFKVYWDFALNTDAKARVQDVYLGNGNQNITNPSLNSAAATNTYVQSQNEALADDTAWLAGIMVGQNKKKGDWSIKGDFRQVGLGSIDPNTNDSDWADSFLNQQGVRIQAVYNFTDFLTGSLTYFDTWNYKQHLLDGSSPAEDSGTSLPLTGNSTAIKNTSPTQSTVTGYSVGSATTGITGLVGANTTQRLQVDLQWKF